ncbi:MAG: SagB/ThcOx family dehydrogenase [Promethearchaeota archaeon]
MWDKERYEKEFPESDQRKKLPQPPVQKSPPKNAELVDLIPPNNFTIGKKPFIEVVNARNSHRSYTEEPLTLEELSFLLWCTQGVKRISRNKLRIKRNVPSAGSRHSFETYLVINRVQDLKPGLYRYLSLEHKLCFLKLIENSEQLIGEISYNQTFIGKAAVVFYWVTVPYRMEWRYSVLSTKFIAIGAGHMCQNLYLACEAIGAGTCAIGYYDQNKVDELLGIDGEDEFTIYVAPVGKISKKFSINDFLGAPQEQIDPHSFKRFEGKYKRQAVVELKIIEDKLFLVAGEYKEYLEPYNEYECLGDEIALAIRFVVDDDGEPIKMVVLREEGDVVELKYLKED